MNDLLAPNLTREEMPTTSYKPTKIEAFRNYTLSIKFLDRGVIVTVGCKEIAFESISAFLKSFDAYMNDPYTVQQEWLKFFHEQNQGN